MRPNTFPAVLCVLCLSALTLAACRPAEEEAAPGADAAGEEAAAERVENGALGLALVRVPAGFAVTRNEGEELVLERSAEDDAGVVTFELGPLTAAGVNLVDRVWEEKERIEGLPGGEYRGQNELGGVPLGTTFTSRGRFESEEGEMIEEYRALLVHPTQNRVLIVDYEYPVPPSEEGGAGQNRLEELMLVLEQLEPVFQEEAEPPPPEAAPAPEPTTQP
jgi:hypothetical protein